MRIWASLIASIAVAAMAAGPVGATQPAPLPHSQPVWVPSSTYTQTHYDPHPEPHQIANGTHYDSHPEPHTWASGTHYDTHPPGHSYPDGVHYDSHPEPHAWPRGTHYSVHTSPHSYANGTHYDSHPEPHTWANGTHYDPHPEPHQAARTETHTSGGYWGSAWANQAPTLSVYPGGGTQSVGVATLVAYTDDPEHDPVTVTWPDGSNGGAHSHAFGAPGTVTLTVLATDAYGATVSRSVTYDVAETGPELALSFDPSGNARQGETVTLTITWQNADRVSVDLKSFGQGSVVDTRSAASRSFTLSASSPGWYPVCATAEKGSLELTRCGAVFVYDAVPWLIGP